MTRTFLIVLALLPTSICNATLAHFIWLIPRMEPDGQSVIYIRFGEAADDDSTEFLSRLSDLRLKNVSGNAAACDVPIALMDETLKGTTKFTGNNLVIASYDFGVIDRGDQVFRLKYYAKGGADVTDSAWETVVTADDLSLDIHPALADGSVTLRVLFDEKPAAGARVTVMRPGMDEFAGETNLKGEVIFAVTESGIHSVLVRHVEKNAGEISGKKYSETRHYCTIALSIPESGSSTVVTGFQNLLRPVTSFGAAVVSNGIYMYGGHTGNAHSYSTEEQSNELTRLDLKTGEWSTIATGPHLQGLALVTHNGTLYRIGGFTALNSKGEEHDLHSQDSVAGFDPTLGTWEQLPPLPERRSSHDAAVVGDCIYVVGGWVMGDGNTQWHTTAWKLDLSAVNLKWEAITDPPFQRRALALAAHNGRLYVIGGMQKNGPTTAVAVYDPAVGEWSQGPSLIVQQPDSAGQGQKQDQELSSGRMTGFGASAFETGGSLYVTTVTGHLQRLSSDGSRWNVIATGLTPRFFHRLLPLDDNHLIAVGGSNMSIGKFEEVDVIDVRHK
ncbi:MAG: hypothetical protein MK102_07615 [Fuerstiella sp.]|nr:hypothetical protein [Fuerstiella sp.]